MIQVGDRVKINIGALYENGGIDPSIAAYVEDNLEEVYEVVCINSRIALAEIQLDHFILGGTSFFEDELIVVEGE